MKTSSTIGPTLANVRAWPATVDVPAAARALGVSRSALYDAVRSGSAPVRVITVCGRKRVLTASLLAVLEGEAA